MDPDQTDSFWSFGNSLIRVHSVCFHMIKSEVHFDIIYIICSRCESRQLFQDKMLTGSGLINYQSVKFNIYKHVKI